MATKNLLALFGAINISGTGRIDKDEFADLFYYLDLEISDDYLIKLFNVADRDGSGAIEFDDFIQTFEENKKTTTIYEARLKETFEMMDKDGNGFLSPAEIKECAAIICGDTPDDVIDDLIKDADVNDDGQVSYAEFIDIWKMFGKKVTKDRAESMYEVITSSATDGKIRQKTQMHFVNAETKTTSL
eukprot:gene15265-16840_t